LIQWITAGLKIKEARDLKGGSGYLLSNMIAKVTLANSENFISNEALKLINQMNVDLKKYTKEGNFIVKNNHLFMHIPSLYQ
tara:strand:+ start:247 stop:492 length:246 start_codon:yes stop_codon:yes gene_type:complete